MSRPRPMSRTNTMNEDVQVMTQVWHGVLDTLRTLPPMPPGTKITYDENGPHRPVHAIQAEKKTLDDALEQLTMLISLRRNEEAGRSNAQHMPHVIPSVQVSTPSSGGPGGSGVKRKRRTSLSYSASPAPTGIPNSVDSALNSPMPRGGTPGGRDVTHKRKDGGTDHPILMPGTKVAYRQPYEGDETWIQAVVKRCISVDKQKYEVRDTESGETFHTTPQSIVPLPDPSGASGPASLPRNLQDFPAGTQVLGLYPDTTSFYRAEVVSAPIPGTGMGQGVTRENGKAEQGALKGMYRLLFVDDEGEVRVVPALMVIKYPFAGK